ncbi:glycosyltransferase [Rhodococcus zopfii]|uniref:Glycosyltransferase n=2 Tax=Rhodococcus zopfii TaxID=43772 RepID=A0ABU3WJT5_9NOCA|nr:glycosyltransferase [Rhodococcus zopfii]
MDGSIRCGVALPAHAITAAPRISLSRRAGAADGRRREVDRDGRGASRGGSRGEEVVNMPVSVVIPTIGRESVVRAVESALAQTVPVSVTVVVDDPAALDIVTDSVAARNVTVIGTPGRIGGSAARNLGADVSGGEYIAYLDDDDWWEPDKIEKQLAAARDRTAGKRVLVASGMYFHRADSVTEIPSHPYDGRGDVASYLVARPRLRFGTHALQTSGLLIGRELHECVRWDESLPKHQDWDYIVRALQKPGSEFVWVPEALVHVQQDSNGSISKKADHRASLRWLDVHGAAMSGRARADFACTHVLRAALAERSLRGVGRSLSVIARSGAPHGAAVIVGLSGVC